MRTDNANAYPAPATWSLSSILRVAALLLAGFALGQAVAATPDPAGTPAAPAIHGTADGTIEDWHGNVRRSH